jgi:hypothetical protein
MVAGWNVLSANGSEITGPAPRASAPIVVRAVQANRWQEGPTEVWMLRGECEISQDRQVARSRDAVLWVVRADPLSGEDSRIIAYLEGDVVVDYARAGAPHRETGLRVQRVHDRQWLGRFSTSTEIDVQAPVTGFEPQVRPAIVERGLAAREAESGSPVRLAQFSNALPGYLPARPNLPSSSWNGGVPPGPVLPAPPRLVPPGAVGGPETVPPPLPSSSTTRPAARRIIIRSRSNVRMEGKVFPSPDGQETIAAITSGVNVVVDGIQNVRGWDSDKIDIETDRIVIWTAKLDTADVTGSSSGEKFQSRDTPLELYLEGNIVFREGDRVIYAERMYYNVRGRYGIVLNAEVLTPVPSYQGLVRLKANVLQQLNETTFRATGAAITSSRMGVPRYWVQAESVDFRDLQTERRDPLTGVPVVDPETNDVAVDHQYLARSFNNFVFLGGVPVFYWPVMATNLEKPTYFVDGVRVRHDGVFGWQVFTDLDLYQLLRIQDPPEGTKWTISPDYLSRRGFALGTHARYDRVGFLNVPGPVRGLFDAWGIDDQAGTDDLGQDRRAVPFDNEFRGRVLWEHRHYLPNNFQFTAEVGWISDRNFLEEYYKSEWDEHKDEITGLELKQLVDHNSWSVAGSVRLNDFVTQTEWLPRADHFLLGHPLFNGLNWFAHSHAGYAQLQTADLPPPGTEPTNASLPWETDSLGVRYEDRSGVVAATRQELDWPFPLGPLTCTPYVLGEAAYWQQDRDEAEVTRLFGQGGVRASLPFWRVDPTVRSELFNLNSLAHKVSLETDAFYADASQDLTRLPMYEPLNDDATGHFQRRFIPALFGGVLPPAYDERLFALRYGLQKWVSSPSTEIADDLFVVQGAVRQRWQTKRGAPGRERIVDWITFDVEGSLFPNEADNFEQAWGLANYDFRWQVGDRFALLSDGFMDFFDGGLKTFSLGGNLSRPEHGSLYLGVRSIEGPISSNIVSLAVNYRMSEKWILNAAASVAMGSTGNVGESLQLIRIGESLLLRVGLYYDQSRDNVGANFAVEPRFLAGKLGRVGGVPIPPAGVYGLE